MASRYLPGKEIMKYYIELWDDNEMWSRMDSCMDDKIEAYHTACFVACRRNTKAKIVDGCGNVFAEIKPESLMI